MWQSKLFLPDLKKNNNFAVIYSNAMAKNYSIEESETPKVNEPCAEYGTATNKRVKVFSREEIARCMTLEESERLITEKIYRFYHPEE